MCDFVPPCVIHELPVTLWPPIERDALGQGMKAAARRTEGRISVDSSFYDPLDSDIARLGLLCHEKAHLEGADCESCADRRGGQILKALGVGTDAPAVSMLLNSLVHRDNVKAARDFDEGYRGIRGPQSADACACSGSIDEAGLCKSPAPGTVPVVSFHSTEGLDTRIAKARARGADPRLCRCVRGASNPPLRGLFASMIAPCPPLTHCTRRVPGTLFTDLGDDAPGGGDAADTISAALRAAPNIPQDEVTQTFATEADPVAPLTGIIAQWALHFFPDDPLRYAWLTLGTADRESPRIAGSSTLFDPTGDNSRSGPGGGPLNKDGSIDHGIMELNDKAHPAMIARQLAGGGPAWADASQNIFMGMNLMARARAQYPGDIPAQLLRYAGGPAYVAKTLRVTDPGGDRSAYRQADVPDMPTARADRIAFGAKDPALYLLATLKKWGVADVLDDSQWGTSSSPAAQTAASETVLGKLEDFELRAEAGIGALEAAAIRNWYWEVGGLLLVLVVVGLLVARHQSRKGKKAHHA